MVESCPFRADILSARYAQDDSFSDFEIVCNGVSFAVHRLVISMHSTFFDRICKSGFKESEDRRVDLSEDPVAAVCLMINYFYTFAYSWGDESLESLPPGARGSEADGWGWFLIHAQLAVLADKYDIPDLGTLATAELERQIARATNEANDDTRTTAENQSAAADLIEATRYVYGNTAPERTNLREMMLRAFQGRHFRLTRYAKRTAFEELLGDVPEFTADYIEVLSGIKIGCQKRPDALRMSQRSSRGSFIELD